MRTGGNPSYEYAAVLNQTYQEIFETYYAGLMAQTHLKDVYDTLEYVWDEDSEQYTLDTTALIATLDQAIADDPDKGKELLSDFARCRRGEGYWNEVCFLSLREHFIQQDPDLAWIFDTGGLDVYDQLGQGDGWYYPHMFGTWGTEVVKGSPTQGDGYINSLTGNDVLYGTDRDEVLLNEDGDALFVAGGGNDRIWAGDGADILDGGEGDDTLYGETGDDTYIFRIGSGNDTIIDIDSTEGNLDTIFIGSSLTPDDVTLKRVGNNLVLAIVGTSDSITVQGFFSNDSTLYRVEQVQFMDGTLWSESDIVAKVYEPTDNDDFIYGGSDADELSGLGGNDTIHGLASNDTIHGDDGNDVLYAGSGDDTIEGGSGDDLIFGDAGSDLVIGGLGADTLDGGEGDDTYVFDRGSGHDIIDDTDTTAGNTDTLELGADILPSDVQIQRIGNDLKLTILDTGDSVTVTNWLEDDTPVHGIEVIQFADGTAWDTATIQDMLTKGTAAADEIIGFSTADVIEGFDSDDTLYGRGGDDTITSGSGDDVVYAGEGNDTVVSGDGNDIVVGGSGADLLDPGAGTDYLYGGDTATWSGSLETNGNDRYVFDAGYGHDVILDHDRTTGNIDTVQLTDGITTGDVSLYRDGEDLVLSLNDGADTLTIQQWFWNDSQEYRVEVIEFADGTTWDVDTMKQLVLQGTADDDTLIGTAAADTLNGYAGNDRIFGRADDDILSGGTGNDTIAGEAGDDYISAGDEMTPSQVVRAPILSTAARATICSLEARTLIRTVTRGRTATIPSSSAVARAKT